MHERWLKALVAISAGLLVGAGISTALIATGTLPPNAEGAAAVAAAASPAAEPVDRAAPPLSPREQHPEAQLRPLVPRDPEGALVYEPMAEPAVRRPSIDDDHGMRVVALCDPGFRRHHGDWRAIASSRVRGAADILWRELTLDLVEAAPPQEWEPREGLTGIVDLLNGVHVQAPAVLEGTGARFVIGMALRDRPEPQGLCGLSRVLTDHCVVLEASSSPMPEEFYHVTIAHEIAHCFGAFHSPEADSIMVPRLIGDIPTRFDTANRRVLELTRGANLSDGESTVSEEALVRMADIIRERMVPGDHNGAADQIARRAYRALKRNDLREGERLCRLALEYAPNLWDTQANLAYSLLRQGRRDEAREALRDALEGDPGLREQQNIRELSDALLLREVPRARSQSEGPASP